MNWFSSLVGTTAFKYLITIVASWLAAKLGVEQGSVEGIIAQTVGLVMAVWGVIEAARPKIVSPDKTIVHLDKPEVTFVEKAKVNSLADAIKNLTNKRS